MTATAQAATVQPARLLPGASSERVANATDSADKRRSAGVIRGKALIFWDPKVPGKKLDAIDTDQITPSNDCVSETLETLDARWKAGSFRSLMPDFRPRVPRGGTFAVGRPRPPVGRARE